MASDDNFASRVREYSHRDINAKIWGFRKITLDYRTYVSDLKGIVLFDSICRALGQDYSHHNDVYLMLQGNYGGCVPRAMPTMKNAATSFTWPHRSSITVR